MPFAPQDVAQSDMADESRIFKQAKVIGPCLMHARDTSKDRVAFVETREGIAKAK